MENGDITDGGREIVFQIASTVLDPWPTVKAQVKNGSLNFRPLFRQRRPSPLPLPAHTKQYTPVNPLHVDPHRQPNNHHPPPNRAHLLRPPRHRHDDAKSCASASWLGSSSSPTWNRPRRPNLEKGIWILDIKAVDVTIKGFVGNNPIVVHKLKQMKE